MNKRLPNPYENYRKREFASHHFYLLGKVVLIIGNDEDLLQTLVKQLAKKGADIALFCWQMPIETVYKIMESVRSVGRNFLLIEEVEHQFFSADRLIQTVKTRMGRLDIFIDLSAQSSSSSLPNEQTPEWNHWNCQLTKEALEEITRLNDRGISK